MSDLRFPIGKYTKPGSLSNEARLAAIDTLAAAPSQLRKAVANLSDAQLDTPYRPGGWTVRQVVHHVPDSHLNAYVRIKLALTENHPTIKTYDEARWAMLEDSRTTPVTTSLTLLDAVHDRMLRVLRAIPPSDFARTVNHPENGVMTVDDILAMYAWHGRHHTAHITGLRERSGWT
jgi:uncharacterized damage-inducible protein DinB